MGMLNSLALEENNCGALLSVDKLAEEFKTKYLKMWWNTESDFQNSSEKYNAEQQLANEKEANKFINSMISKIDNLAFYEDRNIVWNEEFKAEVKSFAKKVLGFSDGYLDILFKDGFVKSTGNFIRDAREFDSKIIMEDLFQAIRNVWIMNTMQLFFDKDVEYSSSIFAYSMLYPYSDNYIDSTEISSQKKMEISERFKKRLAGERIEPCNSYEQALFDLVKKIEDQYFRLRYPEVFESLLGIHNAQGKSLLQQDRVASPYEEDILGISFEKGGMSVLADAYLLSGTLSKEEADFAFGFGVILQLADDLQDVKTDLDNGHMTIFSQTAEKWKLDKITNRLFNFVSRVLDSFECFSSPKSKELKNMIKFNCNFLMIQAIAKNTNVFSKQYSKNIEEYSKFRFRYMQKLYGRLKKEYSKLNKNHKGKLIDEISCII